MLRLLELITLYRKLLFKRCTLSYIVVAKWPKYINIDNSQNINRNHITLPHPYRRDDRNSTGIPRFDFQTRQKQSKIYYSRPQSCNPINTTSIHQIRYLFCRVNIRRNENSNQTTSFISTRRIVSVVNFYILQIYRYIIY